LKLVLFFEAFSLKLPKLTGENNKHPVTLRCGTKFNKVSTVHWNQIIPYCGQYIISQAVRGYIKPATMTASRWTGWPEDVS
jgi:hypothetical protein